MRLSAVDCLQRGVASLAANWELVLVHWLQLTLTLVLVLLGVVVPVMALGVNAAALVAFRSPENLEQGFEDLMARLPDLLPAFLLSLLTAFAIWTLAFLVYCWFQAGTYGVLTAAERNAPPGAARSRHGFRAFSPAAFLDGAGRHVWRFFWFLNLFGLWVSLALLAAVLLLAWGALGLENWGMGALMAFGCGGFLLFFAALLVLGAWFNVAQADLAHESSGVWIASRRGWQVLGRRLGAVVLLLLIFLAATFLLSSLFFPLSLVVDFGLPDDLFIQIAAHLVLAVLQGFPNAMLAIALAGAFVALVRSETQPEQEMYAA